MRKAPSRGEGTLSYRAGEDSQSHVVHGHRLTKRRNAARHEEEDWLWDALRLQRVVGEVGKEGEKGGR